MHGIHQHFCEIPMCKASGEIFVDIISWARKNYTGYSFQITDLRDMLHSSGTRDRSEKNTIKEPNEKKISFTEVTHTLNCFKE